MAGDVFFTVATRFHRVGFVFHPFGLRAVMVGAAVALLACSAAAEGVPGKKPAAVSLAEILAQPIDAIDRGSPVRVCGVVTYRESVDDAGYLCIQQGDAGLWLRYASLHPSLLEEVERIVVGDAVEATGILDRGAYAPTIEITGLERHGTAGLPEPLSTDGGRLSSGADNGVRVSLDAVVQGLVDDGGRWKLIVESDSRRLVAWLKRAVAADFLGRLIDAEVRFVGVVGAIRNTRGEFLRPGLLIADAADVTVMRPASAAPFTAPSVPLESIGQYRREPNGGHRIRTSGVVTMSERGRFFYIQNGLHGVRVESTQQDALAPGDMVDVAGFMHMRRGLGELTSAVYRRTGVADPPPPVPVQPDEIVSVNVRARVAGRVARPCSYHGCLVKSTAKLVEITPPAAGHCRMLLATDESILSAILPAGAYPRFGRLVPGSRLAVTGIAELDLDAPDDHVLVADPEAARVGLRVRSADDVTVVQAAPWWTPHRLATALAIVVGVLGLAGGWVVSLRKQVAMQAARLAAEMQSRHDAAIEHTAAMRERSRLSANLHDTVLQTVTGIGFQLRLCQKMQDRNEPRGSSIDKGSSLGVAQRMVEHAIQQLRGNIWALHMAPSDGQSFADSLRALADRLSGEHRVPVVVEFDDAGLVADMPDLVAGSLLLVAQEAVRNAVRHGGPVRIRIAVTACDGNVGMTVRDDGRGFDTARRPGPAQGHFGIEGMRERVERLGGRFWIDSDPSSGTTVHASLPLDETVPRLSGWAVATGSQACSDEASSTNG